MCVILLLPIAAVKGKISDLTNFFEISDIFQFIILLFLSRFADASLFR